jgi:hypothetical protein
MRRACFSLCLVLTVGVGLAFVVLRQSAAMAYAQTQGDDRLARIPPPQGRFDLEVLVDGRPMAEYFARGRTYVEALKGAEYELRVRNPTPIAWPWHFQSMGSIRSTRAILQLGTPANG